MAAPAEVPADAGHSIVEPGVELGDPWAGVDAAGLKRAVSDQAARPVTGAGDMASYLAAAVSDVSHREVVGPLLNGGGASGVVLRRARSSPPGEIRLARRWLSAPPRASSR